MHQNPTLSVVNQLLRFQMEFHRVISFLIQDSHLFYFYRNYEWKLDTLTIKRYQIKLEKYLSSIERLRKNLRHKNERKLR